MAWDTTTGPRPLSGTTNSTGGTLSSSVRDITLRTIEVDLGRAPGRISGEFVIDGLSELVEGQQVLVFQAAPATDMIQATGVATSDTEITVYWQATTPQFGVVTFNYLIGG